MDATRKVALYPQVSTSCSQPVPQLKRASSASSLSSAELGLKSSVERFQELFRVQVVLTVFYV